MLAPVATPVAAQAPPAGSGTPAGPPPAGTGGPAAAPPAQELPPISVIGLTPLPALGIPLEKYPGNVQRITGTEVENQHLTDISELLYRNLGSVNINAVQGNPWQSDLTYRGFLAGPLTGSPIGLSVYLDGMRFNDGFGDTINWDLILENAIADIDVIPGSNPLYGLNTLGGALSLRTKRGFDHPGTQIDAYGGSFGRWAVEGQHGGSRGPFDWFVAFNVLDENGWRDQSASELRQVFSKVGYRTTATDLELSYSWAGNDLVGNGLAPESLLARDRSAVYTFPDRTENTMHLVNLRGSQWLTESLLLSGNAFYRNYQRDTLNGDAEVECVDDETDGQVFDASGRPLHLGLCQGSAAGFFDEEGNPLTGGELELEAEGEDRTTSTRTQDWGTTLQLQHTGRILGRGNRMTFGVAYDGHETRFKQHEAPSEFVPDGNSTGTRRTGPFETEVDVRTRQQNVGVYLSDTFDLTERLAVTLAGRYQHVNINISDRSGENPDLDGDHSFDRFSPAVGFTFRALQNLTTYFSYSEGFRAPTPAELTCADPDDPCNLPNAFVADPPLDPVLARTYELGARGKLPVGDELSWSLGLFRTDLRDDILFTVTETGGGGFFQNVGATRRQGVEAGLQGRWSRLRYYLSYAFIDATYQSDETLASVTEPSGVTVKSGDTIPGIPQHNVKFGAEVAVLKNLWIGADVVAVSDSYFRGDDGNDRSRLDGYALLNLSARYVPVKYLELWARIDNVTNADYETAGARNFNAFADPIAVERFVSPGAPIAGWVGAKVRF
jgi:outer membrane receptor protein involved in Fe transport